MGGAWEGQPRSQGFSPNSMGKALGTRLWEGPLFLDHEAQCSQKKFFETDPTPRLSEGLDLSLKKN